MGIVRCMLKKYYLSKLSKNEITKEEVAELYFTSVENVEKALKEYNDNRNPFKRVDSQTRQGTIQIIISIVSVVLVLLTLFEMQAERNAAYMPNISINSTGIMFAWDEERNINNDISGLGEEYQALWREYESSSYSKGLAVKTSLTNTGIGVAKDVCVDWLYRENIPLFQNIFSDNDDVSVGIDNNRVNIHIKDDFVIGSFYSDSGNYEYGFLSANLDKSESLRIPYEFIQLYELAYAYGKRIPKLNFVAKYKDVQGETYEKAFIIDPKPIIVITAPENNGFGIVELSIQELKTEHISFFRKNKQAFLTCIGGIIIGAMVHCIHMVLFELNRRRKKMVSKNIDTQKNELLKNQEEKNKP